MTTRAVKVNNENLPDIIANKMCVKCKAVLTTDNVCKSKLNDYYYVCKDCRNKDVRDRAKAIINDPIAIAAIYAENNSCCKCNILLTIYNWSKAFAGRHVLFCKDCAKVENKKSHDKLKEATFEAYGGQCVCCGTNALIFLTIDHIDGNGAKHRENLSKELGGWKPTGKAFYRWLKKQGYPKDNYRVLCFNCNFAIHVQGSCPHQNN